MGCGKRCVGAGSPLVIVLATALLVFSSYLALAPAGAPWCMRLEWAGAAGRDSLCWDVL